MDFEDLFERFFTSQNELEKNLEEIKKSSPYDESFSEISKNEGLGTAFFHQFSSGSFADFENPPFQVSPFKTYVLSDKPDLLRQ